MNVENWIQLLVPVIGIIVVTVSTALTYYFSKRKQILTDESRLKEKFYLNYIEAVSNMVIFKNSDKARDQLADALNQLLLVGSSEVVRNLMIFHNYLNLSNQDGFDSSKHDELLTALIKSMRGDLYRTSKVNEGYPIIHLTAKAPRK